MPRLNDVLILIPSFTHTHISSLSPLLPEFWNSRQLGWLRPLSASPSYLTLCNSPCLLKVTPGRVNLYQKSLEKAEVLSTCLQLGYLPVSTWVAYAKKPSCDSQLSQLPWFGYSKHCTATILVKKQKSKTSMKTVTALLLTWGDSLVLEDWLRNPMHIKKYKPSQYKHSNKNPCVDTPTCFLWRISLHGFATKAPWRCKQGLIPLCGSFSVTTYCAWQTNWFILLHLTLYFCDHLLLVNFHVQNSCLTTCSS